MLTFALPTAEDREAVQAFYDEFAADGGTCIGFANYKDYPAWLQDKLNRHTGENLPKGFVREDFLLCFEDGKLIGVYSIKFELTEHLTNYGGHVGYAVRPSARNRGLATQIMQQGMAMAHEQGFRRLLCICDEDNVASEKVILKNGGVLEDCRFDPEENVTVKRYWVDC